MLSILTPPPSRRQLQLGGNLKNFMPPLKMAITLMEEYHQKYDSFVFIMISDGESGFPSV
jgi:hypothetical protein